MAEKIGTRIRLLRNALKKTLSDFAKELNMSVSYLSEVENNKTTLSQDNLLLIMSKFAVNPNWLFYGEGEMFKGDIVSKNTDDEFVKVPLVSGFISAGSGAFADNTIETYLSFRKDWIKRKGDYKNMSLVRVSGDSMEPTLSNNDIVLVDHMRKTISKNGIYAICIDYEILLKRLQLINKNTVQVISDNSKYPPFTINIENITINGKAIWYARELPE